MVSKQSGPLIVVAIAALFFLIFTIVWGAVKSSKSETQEKVVADPSDSAPRALAAPAAQPELYPTNLIVAPGRPGIAEYLQDQEKLAHYQAVVESGEIGVPYPGRYPPLAQSGGSYIGPVVAPFKASPAQIPRMYQTSPDWQVPFMRS